MAEKMPQNRGRLDLVFEHTRAHLLLASEDVDATTRFQAGLEFIVGGKSTEGADLVAHTARTLLQQDGDASRVFARSAAALEAALGVYRRESRSNISRWTCRKSS